MVTDLFGDINIGGEIRIISICGKCIGVARLAYQMGKFRISGFGFGERMHLIVQVEICHRIDGRIRIAVINTSSCFCMIVLTDIESIFSAVVLGYVLRPLHQRSFQPA